MGIRLTGSTSSAEMAYGSEIVRWNGLRQLSIVRKTDGEGPTLQIMLNKDIV